MGSQGNMYHAQVYYIKQMVNTWMVNFVIIPDLEHYSRVSIATSS